MNDNLVLTQSGYDDLKKEYNKIVTQIRPAIIQRIKEARELGDLSENFDYQDAKKEQSKIEGRLAEIKYYLENATIIENNSNDNIGLGNTVVIQYEDDEDDTEEVVIVGQAESDPNNGKISVSSPLGKALIGKSCGDNIEYEAPFGIIHCKIISVK